MIKKKKRIAFSGLGDQYRGIKKEMDKAIARVMNSGWYILGKELESFEKEFAAYCGTKYAVGCASGTEAIALSLMALGIGRGDEVITVPNTAVPTVCAVSMTQAKPVFVDVDEYFTIDASRIENAITKKTKAILPVHLYGQMADMEAINKLAKKYKLAVIEDAAQAHGAKLKGKRAGSWGVMGCFSFYPTKNLGCYGDGGMVTTNDRAIYEKLLMLRNYGQLKRYHHTTKGINSRLDELQAAVLRVKLKYLDKWNRQRVAIAKEYSRLLKGSCVTPGERRNAGHIFHLYVIRAKNREELQKYLEKSGIGTLIHYPIPVHLQKAYAELGYKKGDFPMAERFAGEVLSLPMHESLPKGSVKHIAERIGEFASKTKVKK